MKSRKELRKMRRGHPPTSTFGDVPMIWGWDSPGFPMSFQSVPGEVEKEVTVPLTRISMTVILFQYGLWKYNDCEI